MSHGFLPMSTPPPSGPPPGYGTPPPGYGLPPPKKNNTATVILVVLAVVFGGGFFVVVILAAILFPVFQKVRGNARLASCESNVRLIDLGLMQYQQDHNDKFPTGDYESAVAPYLQSKTLFRCPADAPGAVSYSFNRNLQGIAMEKVSEPSETVAVYEGTKQTLNFRHERAGANVAVVGFVDGSVEAISQSQAQFLRWKP